MIIEKKIRIYPLPPSYIAPVRITKGCLPPMQLLNDSKSVRNHMPVSLRGGGGELGNLKP
jgi:hypothetical protein